MRCVLGVSQMYTIASKWLHVAMCVALDYIKVVRVVLGMAGDIILLSHSYCLSLPLCLEWYNGSITPRVHSGVTRRTECSYTTDHLRPLNKCVKPLSGVGQVRLTLTFLTPDSGLTYIYSTLWVKKVCRRVIVITSSYIDWF